MQEKKILIIDDEEGIRQLMRLALEENGYEVLDAANGKDGLKIYRISHPDLVITDIFMPEMDGLETIMALRRENPDVKIMTISGGGSRGHDYLPAARKLGASCSLPKPFTRQDLLGAVRGLFGAEIRKGMEDETRRSSDDKVPGSSQMILPQAEN
jgi:CheY-like chemotaxis protein